LLVKKSRTLISDGVNEEGNFVDDVSGEEVFVDAA
jgi:hypothetical protein